MEEKREELESQFGQRVRAEREARGWSQEELARRLTAKGLPIHPTTVSKMEWDGKPRSVRIAEVIALAELFRVSTDELLGRSAPSPAELARTTLLRRVRDVGRILLTLETMLGDAVSGYAETAGADDLTELCVTATGQLAETVDLLDTVRQESKDDEASA
ncbi:MAG: helix-turn-helix domain-containing protein [Mycobacterium sp.]|uniref:helix-turn-helix domain-containing protein n=1 Tax=Mycobacterium sp. TaxID=1785 RepID=UPI003F97D3FF